MHLVLLSLHLIGKVMCRMAHALEICPKALLHCTLQPITELLGWSPRIELGVCTSFEASQKNYLLSNDQHKVT